MLINTRWETEYNTINALITKLNDTIETSNTLSHEEDEAKHLINKIEFMCYLNL